MQKYRHIILPVCVAIILSPLLQAQALQPHLDGGLLHVAAPQLRFLAGRALERLHNGAAVTFAFQLTAVSGSSSKTISRVASRCVLSFDLWEERFSAVEPDPARHAASHLSPTAAEAWCLDNLSLPVSALAGEKSFVLKLDIRAEEPGNESTSDSKPGLTLAGLIEVFSRKPKEEPSRWFAVSGTVRLEDLKDRKPNHR